MNKEQLDYIESNIDNAEAIGALSFGWADTVRELVREMRKDQRVLSTIAEVLSVTVSTEKLKSENVRMRRTLMNIESAKRLHSGIPWEAMVMTLQDIARQGLKGGEG